MDFSEIYQHERLTWPSKKTAVEHVKKHSSYVFCIALMGLLRIIATSWTLIEEGSCARVQGRALKSVL